MGEHHFTEYIEIWYDDDGFLTIRNKRIKKMNITPLGARVLVEAISEGRITLSQGGIALPEGPLIAPQSGIVRGLGAGVTLPIHVRDRIWFSRGSLYRFDPRKENEWGLVDEGNIIAIIAE
jgi:co-chaperonin GroES (HSP10)